MTMPVYAVTGASARRHLWSARVHRRHAYAPVLPVIIHGIRAYFGNTTQITLLCMPVSAESLHRKTMHNGGYSRPRPNRGPIA